MTFGCPFATTPLQPLPEPPQENPPESPVRFVERILDENCGMCHGSQARNDCNASSCAPGITYIDDLARLVTSGKIVPCNWQGSLVAQRIQDGSMPPAGSGVRAMRPNAQKVVADYIDGICSSLIFGESSAAELQEVKRILGEHCNDCHGFVPASPEGRPDGLVNIQDVTVDKPISVTRRTDVFMAGPVPDPKGMVFHDREMIFHLSRLGEAKAKPGHAGASAQLRTESAVKKKHTQGVLELPTGALDHDQARLVQSNVKRTP